LREDDAQERELLQPLREEIHQRTGVENSADHYAISPGAGDKHVGESAVAAKLKL
jgi:hypothetical protein